MADHETDNPIDFGNLLGQLGGLGGAGDLLRKAQELPTRIARIKKEAFEKRIEVTAGGGTIQITVRGDGEIEKLRIDPAIVNSEEIEELEDLVLAGVNEAHRMARDMVHREVSQATEGLPIPPDLLGGLSGPG